MSAAIEIRKLTDLIIVVALGAGWLFNFGLISVLRDLLKRTGGQ